MESQSIFTTILNQRGRAIFEHKTEPLCQFASFDHPIGALRYRVLPQISASAAFSVSEETVTLSDKEEDNKEIHHKGQVRLASIDSGGRQINEAHCRKMPFDGVKMVIVLYMGLPSHFSESCANYLVTEFVTAFRKLYVSFQLQESM
jgi:hypothetical protein